MNRSEPDMEIDNSQIPKEVIKILSTLKASDYPSYLVGGCVRDLLLCRKPKDFDICTQAKPEEVKKIFSNAGARVIPTGIKYGTVTVLTEEIPVEVTTFRKTVLFNGSTRANEIIFGYTAEEDVQKRDFTINGLLYDGENIIDYLGALADLECKIIRAVEDPDGRFREDGLRMMRAVRFVCQLGFELDLETRESIVRNASLILNAAPERIREELVKILLSNCPSKGFHILHQTGLLEYILPELERCYGFAQHNPHHSQDVFEHIMTVVENTPPDLKIRLAALLHDIGKPLTFTMGENGIGHFYGHDLKSHDLAQDVLFRLKFDNRTMEDVLIMIKEHMKRLHAAPKNSALKRLIKRVKTRNIDALLELQIADVKRPGKEQEVRDLEKVKAEIQAIMQEKEPMNIKELAINGDDLKAMGIKEGVTMGKILNALLEKVMEQPDLNTRENLLSIVKGMNLEIGKKGIS